MSGVTATRRPLRFDSLDRVMPEVDRLLAGHTTVGKWSLGQICNHLTASLVSSVEGFPHKAPWVVRRTVGPIILRRVIRTGNVPEGIKIPEAMWPKPGLDARAEAETLRGALRAFAAHSGPLAEHPLGGPISRADWEAFHCVHSAHHLSFALPADPA